ncbi:MAG: TatD family hydrolase [Planctomycetota bacterium]
MIDSHAHLYFDRFDDDRNAVFDRACAEGVEAFVVVGCDLASSRAAIKLASLRADVYPTAGFHPTDIGDLQEQDWDALEALLAEGECVAVGETGLDYYWDRTTPKDQRAALLRQIDLALRHDLPLVVHCRDAWDALLEILEAHSEIPAGVMHCFSGDLAAMERSLALGFDISFAGPLTYKKNEGLRECCRLAPADRIHVETDCPFLPPQAWRGKRNEPAYLSATLQKLAEVRGLSLAEADAATTSNTRRLFGI